MLVISLGFSVSDECCGFQSNNDQRNRAAAVDVDIKFDAIRRSGSRNC